ncbi:ABC1 family protein-like protein [Polyplosphaeria fusca]|uniref:ABC1 family protein-like protein n=1 Tax=Polyplosphaeria fusca TaxID=682080 RepID=A0A9P4R1G9_9PLEO|nr:ABC1 family protein-like protein [Polyplosphaeria fusca]
MKAATFFGRQCLRQSTPAVFRCRISTRPLSSGRSSFTRKYFATPKFPRRTILWSGAAGATLSPLAFIDIGNNGSDDGEKTHEEAMLEASTKELKDHVPRSLQNSKKYRRGVYFFVDMYIIEPICTGLRFLHLVIIFVPVIATIPVIWLGTRQKERHNVKSGTLWWYRFLVRSMERAGAAFIKLGQWAASRSDVFPLELCRIMSTLHSHAPAHSLDTTMRTVEKAFDGRRFEDIFEEFDAKPLGVGAIAQVYKAKLKPDLATPDEMHANLDTPTLPQRIRKNVHVTLKSIPQRVPSNHVAIKVLHPGIERVVCRDLKIMGFFASLINAIPTMEWFSFPDEVTQFGEMMRLQLDLRIEAANLTMFRNNFKNRTTAWFPYPYTEYTTREVLIEEFAQGIPLESFLQNGGGVFQKEIADEGLDAFLTMVLIDNFIHADLHPGNIMVRFYKPEKLDVSFFSKAENRTTGPKESPDVTEEVLQKLRPFEKQPKEWLEQLQQIDDEGYRPQLIFIDTGLVTELNAKNRTNFLDLFKAVAEFDGYKAGHLMVERCRQPEVVINGEVFALRMQHLVLNVKSRTFALGNIKIGDILNEVLCMVRNHHVRLEGDFVNVVLSILLLEGIGRNLNPDLDLFAGALPILRRLGAKSGSSMISGGDFSMLRVWAGLEARNFLQASSETVERCVKYDQLSPNI